MAVRSFIKKIEMGTIVQDDLSERSSVPMDRRLTSTLLLMFLIVVILRSAWITEDAYIMFRVIDNLLDGYGLTWNISERVQVFTAPLWTFIVAGVNWMTGELYFTPILLGVASTVAAVWILGSRIATSFWPMIVATLPLILSKAFIDYSTSGLENPLSFLLIGFFYWTYFRPASVVPRKHLLQLAFISSLIMLNRLDTVLLVAPALVHEFFRLRAWKHMGVLIIGSLPFILWEIFSLTYFGFPFPNTAYAKLNTGIDPYSSFVQGIFYLFNSLASDPITLFTIGIALILLSTSGTRLRWMIALGIILQLIYTVRIGGDFMSGRLLAAPLFAAAIGIAITVPDRLHRIPIYTLLLLYLLIGLAHPDSPVRVGADYYRDYEAAVDQNGIADERGFYFRSTGLLNIEKGKYPDHVMRTYGEKVGANVANEPVFVLGNIGMFGYFTSRDLHILDYYGLADALIARLPSEKFARIGHFNRDVPRGYEETLRIGENKIFHPDLAQYYNALSKVISGPLFSVDRFREIYKLNTGAYDHLIDSYLATRHDALYPLVDLLSYEAYSQYTTGWWSRWQDGPIWGWGPENAMVVNLKDPLRGTMHIVMDSPIKEQRLKVLLGHAEIGKFNWNGPDTLRVEIPVELQAGQNILTFRYKNWNGPDHPIADTEERLAVRFIELGIDP
ncbi:MAG: hypothetical protein M3R08_09710 [Bacteroidota bacterium]|nr:hypothetical protein [Bacteroidota bacterium]